MTEKRFKMKKLEYESYFIDSQQEYVDEDEPNFKIDGEKTLSDSQILDLLNENEQLKSEIKDLNDVLTRYEEKDLQKMKKDTHMDDELSSDEFFKKYMDEMDKVGYEVFGIRYMDDYVNLFPSEDEQAVRDSLTRFAESFHKGHNALPVIILVNKYYIKSWLETGNVKDGYGNLVKL